MLLKKKKQLLKRRSTSRKNSTVKVNKNKSITSIKRARKLNTKNDRVPSTISSRRSLPSRATRTQSKTPSTGICFSFITPLIDILKIQIESNKITHQTDGSTSKQMMNGK